MLGLYRELSSSDYHTHKGSYSSSQLKTMLDDPEIFHHKYILGNNERETVPAFEVGGYSHCAVLEPEKLLEDCAVFEGVRRGKVWEEFKLLHKDKNIITKSEKEQVNAVVLSVQKSELAQSYISNSKKEISCFADLIVLHGRIYCNESLLDLNTGWKVDSAGYDLAYKHGTKIKVKVRADAIGDDFIFDLKTTTGNCKDHSSISNKISNYQYDLSASLYLDIFSISTSQRYEKFIFCFASKDYGNSQCYIASEDSIKIGRVKWVKAIKLLAKYIENGWTFKEELQVIEPNFMDRKYLIREKEIDL